MEDDEEYSYTGYSKNTVAEMAQFKDNDEVYTYSGYGEELVDAMESESAVAEEVRTNSYGDFIIEEFSAETNVPRIAQITKLPTTVVTYLFALAYLIIGVLCVTITRQITEVLPYVVGAMMVIIGLVRFILALVHHEYRSLKTNRTATSLIVVALGAMIIFQQFDATNDSAIMLISVVWGILGLFEGARAFNHAFKRIANSERCVFYLIKGLIEVVVAFMLLYRPDSHDAHHFHIIVFGANLIFDAILMIPQVKNFLTMK
ncbi:MAG: DUF308 domain-containing protein [Clostridia bacterium]|nr:DUF308 domain-containing protein [Clostridia bacterium]